MSDRIYEDYTDEEIERMEREFDDWQRWTYEQRDRLEDVANAQRNAKPAPC